MMTAGSCRCDVRLLMLAGFRGRPIHSTVSLETLEAARETLERFGVFSQYYYTNTHIRTTLAERRTFRHPQRLSAEPDLGHSLGRKSECSNLSKVARRASTLSQGRWGWERCRKRVKFAGQRVEVLVSGVFIVSGISDWGNKVAENTCGICGLQACSCILCESLSTVCRVTKPLNRKSETGGVDWEDCCYSRFKRTNTNHTHAMSPNTENNTTTTLTQSAYVNYTDHRPIHD